MKYREMISAITNINIITIEQDKAIKNNPELARMPIGVTDAINRNKKALMKEYDNYTDSLKVLNEKYGVMPNANGDIELGSLSDDDKKKYCVELDELLNVTFDIQLKNISADMFGNYEPTLKELDILGFMMD